MNETVWFSCADPARMLKCWISGLFVGVIEPRRPTDRQLRLFAIACCRSRPSLCSHPADLGALTIAEAWADDPDLLILTDAAQLAHSTGVSWACHAIAHVAAERWANQFVTSEGNEARIADAIREIAGSPWQSAPLAWRDGTAYETGQDALDRTPYLRHRCTWLTPTTVSMAEYAYEYRDFSGLPALADTLEEAGSLAEPLLRHLRGEEECLHCLGDGKCRHADMDEDEPDRTCCRCGGSGWVPKRSTCVRGCWAIDLITGRA